jgi:hypothetical protein
MIPIGHDGEGKGSHPSRRSLSFGDYCRELQNFRNLRFPLAGKIVEGCEEADGSGYGATLTDGFTSFWNETTGRR